MNFSRFAALFLLTALPASAETTRTLHAELPAGPSPFAVENLAGTIRVVPGQGETVIVEATVHAETPELANGFRLDREDGGATIRVRYPLGQVSTVRYPDPRRRHDGWWNVMSFGDATTCTYDGHRVRVSPHHGTLLYADLEIRVPRAPIRAAFRNQVGFIDAQQANGRLDFEVRSADLRLDRLSGEVRVEGTSGDIEASGIKGSWNSRSTSGDCRLDGFQGEAFAFESTSGDLRARQIEADRFSARTTSGDLRLADSKLADFSAEATSGDISFEERGQRLARLHVKTSSGDVSLRLPRESSFDASVSHGNGDVRVDFEEAFTQDPGGRTSRYRHGSGGVQIDARTGSGDLTISPGD